jgi:hypothetical protein
MIPFVDLDLKWPRLQLVFAVVRPIDSNPQSKIGGCIKTSTGHPNSCASRTAKDQTSFLARFDNSKFSAAPQPFLGHDKAAVKVWNCTIVNCGDTCRRIEAQPRRQLSVWSSTMNFIWANVRSNNAIRSDDRPAPNIDPRQDRGAPPKPAIIFYMYASARRLRRFIWTYAKIVILIANEPLRAVSKTMTCRRHKYMHREETMGANSDVTVKHAEILNRRIVVDLDAAAICIQFGVSADVNAISKRYVVR